MCAYDAKKMCFATPEVGIYKRKILRKKVRFKKEKKEKSTKHAIDQEKKNKFPPQHVSYKCKLLEIQSRFNCSKQSKFLPDEL